MYLKLVCGCNSHRHWNSLGDRELNFVAKQEKISLLIFHDWARRMSALSCSASFDREEGEVDINLCHFASQKWSSIVITRTPCTRIVHHSVVHGLGPVSWLQSVKLVMWRLGNLYQIHGKAPQRRNVWTDYFQYAWRTLRAIRISFMAHTVRNTSRNVWNQNPIPTAHNILPNMVRELWQRKIMSRIVVHPS